MVNLLVLLGKYATDEACALVYVCVCARVHVLCARVCVYGYVGCRRGWEGCLYFLMSMHILWGNNFFLTFVLTSDHIYNASNCSYYKD